MIFFHWLSRLPFSWLYALSDLLYVVLSYVVRYRRRVIVQNLSTAFPEKSAAQINKLTRGFYRNLTDLIVETIKLPALSADELLRRVRFQNPELISSRIAAGQPVIILASHQSNWEWLPASAQLNGIIADSVYKQLSSPFFENLMREIRSTFGVNPIPMHRLLRDVAVRRHVPRAIALVADQIPASPEVAYWLPFLNHETAFYPGPEKLARSLQLPVFYVEMVRVRRGYYDVTLHTLAEPPYKDLPDEAILTRYRDRLERTIQANPSDWLWSHKRWKHQREEYIGRGRQK
ncbi:lipid A biosynthesis acyltransferase [Rudanella paleaurantiibacter]|uniref:Lipid A biosynthesis acyltransferase n=1 Tax=Rudanella paleaurantiibacter TaxID=2614655 RepID=A0A7J5TUA6_9BACT|nr:lysophospholipid acyltransferase family protein [Rudanella paleaurantiibacter]KAB7727590.1 lipid A biosynthesis acyltransferase [Rudanella paleaurantiibacter]